MKVRTNNYNCIHIQIGNTDLVFSLPYRNKLPYFNKQAMFTFEEHKM